LKSNFEGQDFQKIGVALQEGLCNQQFVWGSELDGSRGGRKDSKGVQGYDTLMSFLHWLID
jgi:hypothetical protein